MNASWAARKDAFYERIQALQEIRRARSKGNLLLASLRAFQNRSLLDDRLYPATSLGTRGVEAQFPRAPTAAARLEALGCPSLCGLRVILEERFDHFISNPPKDRFDGAQLAVVIVTLCDRLSPRRHMRDKLAKSAARINFLS
jgi:hypothetical protein